MSITTFITKHLTDFVPTLKLKYTFMCIICRFEQELKYHQLFIVCVIMAEGEMGLRFCSKSVLV